MTPELFDTALNTLKSLQSHDEYESAFVFGSVARKEHTAASDIDVKVITTTDDYCNSINHPYIEGIKLDISFNPWDRLLEDTHTEIKTAKRIPMLAESIILFDKKGRLSELKKEAASAKPKKLSKKKIQFIEFMMHHADDKARRNLETDPHTALLAMGINISEILKFHYQLHRHWWVSNKRLLRDLTLWDPPLVVLLKTFAQTADPQKKYVVWEDILNYIAEPLGGRKPLSENNCDCNVCTLHLTRLS